MTGLLGWRALIDVGLIGVAVALWRRGRPKPVRAPLSDRGGHVRILEKEE